MTRHDHNLTPFGLMYACILEVGFPRVVFRSGPYFRTSFSCICLTLIPAFFPLSLSARDENEMRETADQPWVSQRVGVEFTHPTITIQD